jgi:hypothetical protein
MFGSGIDAAFIQTLIMEKPVRLSGLRVFR